MPPAACPSKTGRDRIDPDGWTAIIGARGRARNGEPARAGGTGDFCGPELAAAIAAIAPVAVRESLAIARVADDRDEDNLRALSDAARQRIVSTEDYREGPTAFVEKRKPIWVGR